MSDPRFARIKTDPRFRRPHKHQSKVVVDDRFKSVFAGEGKKKKAAKGGRVDKYGRAVSDTHEQDNLRRFYRLDDEEDNEAAADDKPAPVDYARGAVKPAPVDYARGAVLLESSDEEDAASAEESDDGGIVTLGHDRTQPIAIPEEEAEIPLDEDDFADLDAQAEAARAEQDAEDAAKAQIQPTRRLAVVNLDWDHVRSAHLYKIFASLIAHPTAGGSSGKKGAGSVPRGRVLGVQVYPSQFGKERMAHEEIHGPPTEVFRKKRELDADEVNETTVYEVGEEGEVDADALRKYQLQRMRYYYAIAEFDSVQTASHVFTELEGTELERSANVFDLSYVPDDMSFDDEPRDEANGEAATYKGLDFVTDALRHSKVKLTWDEDDPERNRITRRTLSKKAMEEEDFSALIASASSGSEAESEAEDAGGAPAKRGAERARVRALLLSGDAADTLPEGWGARGPKADADDVGVEITFTPGLSERAAPDADAEETTLEKYQRKLREKRKKRKDEAREPAKVDKAPRAEARDEFFGSASEADEPREEAPKKGKRKEKEKAKGSSKAQEPSERRVSTAEELALIATSDNAGGEPKHFDMKAVLKAEKAKGRKVKKARKGVADGEPGALQEDFAIDVKDDRFKALHDDYTFAIDPTNPQFKKTKSMSALLDERAKRRKRDARDLPTGTGPAAQDAGDEGINQNLQRLVDSVKRKSAASAVDGASAGKRRKV